MALGYRMVTVAIFSLQLACSITTTRESVSTPSPPSSPSPSPSVPAEPTRSIGEPIRLKVDLGDPADDWSEAAFIPYGSSPEALGVLACSDCEGVVPRTVAVDERGTLWIADTFKRRIVHYSAEGRYLAEARFRGAAKVRDIEVLGHDVVAVFENGTVISLDSRGNELARGTVRSDGAPIYLYDLYQAAGGLFAFSFGTDAGRGLRGPVELLDIGSGTAQAAAGLPIRGRSVWISLLGQGVNRWYGLDTTSEDSAVRRRFRVVSVGSGGRALLVDLELEGVTRDRILVSAEPLLPPYSDPVSQGTWLVSLDAQGVVVGNERVSTLEEPSQVLVLGADDRVYRMIYRDDGILIERR